MSGLLEWLTSPVVLSVLTISSVVMFVASIAGVPWLVARIPPDYFSRRERETLGLPVQPRPWWRVLAVIARNLLGLVLLVAGVAMLFLPGQGLLTIFVSLFLLDFPRKKALQRRIIRSRPVLRAVNALRRRAGREPLDADSLDDPESTVD